MNWKELYTMQQQLDQHIEENHSLQNKDLFQQKYLALLVELGELANETRCFKFWSTKPRNEDSIILEEYVDGLHFILSLGLEKGYRYTTSEIASSNGSETEHFNEVFHACTEFYQHPTEDKYHQLFKKFLQLGKILGFTESDIQIAYYKKNEVNFERQKEGY